MAFQQIDMTELMQQSEVAEVMLVQGNVLCAVNVLGSLACWLHLKHSSNQLGLEGVSSKVA